MPIKQGELFCGVNQAFIRDFMAIAHNEFYAAGALLFQRNQSADRFFILIKGEVQLSMGEHQGGVYVGRSVGEIIGWCAMIGREAFDTNARCLSPTYVLAVDRSRFLRLLEKDMENGFLVYRCLAASLGSRLLDCYQALSGTEAAARLSGRKVPAAATSATPE
ncbi:MAG: cyclic nucleotide-binding domain-containing protein [Desulfobacterales bacterium]